MRTEPPRRTQPPPSRRLESSEAMELIVGIVPEICAEGGTLYGFGDVLLRFPLPDGRVVLYMAELESDYYGGHYTSIYWELVGG